MIVFKVVIGALEGAWDALMGWFDSLDRRWS